MSQEWLTPNYFSTASLPGPGALFPEGFRRQHIIGLLPVLVLDRTCQCQPDGSS